MKREEIKNNLEKIVKCAEAFKLEMNITQDKKEFMRKYPNLAKYGVDNNIWTLKEYMTICCGYMWGDKNE